MKSRVGQQTIHQYLAFQADRKAESVVKSPVAQYILQKDDDDGPMSSNPLEQYQEKEQRRLTMFEKEWDKPQQAHAKIEVPNNINRMNQTQRGPAPNVSRNLPSGKS